MTSADTPPPGETPTGGQPTGGTAAATDEGPRVTRDDVADLGRLRRSRTDRHVAGVSGGLARHLDIDPVIVRVAFVVTAFFGGAGLFAYGALWLLVPEEGEQNAPINLDDKARNVALIVVGVLAGIALVGGTWGGNWFPWPLALLALLAFFLLNRRNERRERRYHPPYGSDQTGWIGPDGQPQAPSQPEGYADPYAASYAQEQAARTQAVYYPPPSYAYTAPPRDPRKNGPILFWFTLALVALALGTLGIVDLSGVAVAPSAYPALALGTIGAMLALGAFWGRAGGLVLLGVLTVPVLVGTMLAENVDGEVVTHDPGTAAAVQDRYWNAVGEMVVDLSDVSDVEALDGRTIAVEGGLGRLEVIVPDGVDVDATGDVDGPGSVEIFGQSQDGIDIQASSSTSAGTDRPLIDLDVQLGVGEIVITEARS